MKPKQSLLAVIIVLLLCTAAWFCGSVWGGEKTYEIQPYITTPEYQTDTTRAIDAYERMMERYMDITEKNLNNISEEIKQITKKLDSIDGRLKNIYMKTARIEKTLADKKPKRPTDTPPPAPADKLPPKKSLSPMEDR